MNQEAKPCNEKLEARWLGEVLENRRGHYRRGRWRLGNGDHPESSSTSEMGRREVTQYLRKTLGLESGRGVVVGDTHPPSYR